MNRTSISEIACSVTRYEDIGPECFEAYSRGDLRKDDEILINTCGHILNDKIFPERLNKFVQLGGNIRDVDVFVRTLSIVVEMCNPPDIPIIFPDDKKIPPAAISYKRDIIHDKLVRRFIQPNFEALCASDVQFVYRLYNEIFFNGKLPGGVSFNVSSKMKIHAGVFTCSYNSDSMVDMKLSVSGKLFLSLFRDNTSPLEVHMGGILCTDRVSVLQLVVEHEIAHILVMSSDHYIKNRAIKGKGKVIPHGKLFCQVVRNFFNHTSYTCDIDSGNARSFELGQAVTFSHNGKKNEGKVRKINKYSVIVNCEDGEYRVGYDVID